MKLGQMNCSGHMLHDETIVVGMTSMVGVGGRLC